MIVKSYFFFIVLSNNLKELRLHFTKKENKSKTHLSCESPIYKMSTDIKRSGGMHFAPAWNVLLVIVRIPAQ